MTNKGLLTLFFIVLSFSGFSQFRFQQLIGGTQQDRAQTAFETSDNRFLINGASSSYGAGNVDVMLLKMDLIGQVIWSQTYGTSEYDNAEYAIETSDRSFLCAGRSNISSGQPTSAILFKVDSLGVLLWSNSYGGSANDGFAKVIETDDHGYAAVGYTSSITAGASDVLLVRTDFLGDTVFTRSFGTFETEEGTGIVQLPDGGFVICGRQRTFPGGIATSDGLLLRTDSSGNLLWSQLFGDTLLDEFTSLKVTSDSGLIVTGSTVSYGSGDYDIVLMKTDLSGNPLWTKVFGGVNSDASYDINISNDSTYVLSGYTESLGHGHEMGADSTNVFLLKTEFNGDLIWMMTYGDGLQDEAFNSNVTHDGGYLITGFTRNYIPNDSAQMFVIKTDNFGLSGCHEQNSIPVHGFVNILSQQGNFLQSAGLSASSLALLQNSVITNNDDACLFLKVTTKGISEYDFRVFPNPFTGSIRIVNADQIKFSKIVLYDLPGNIILIKDVHESEITLDLHELSAGSYIIKMVDSDGKSKSKLIFRN